MSQISYVTLNLLASIFFINGQNVQIITAQDVSSNTSIYKQSPMGALNEVEHDICFNDILNITCPNGYTFMIINAFYGIKKQELNKCGFTPDDCIENALSSSIRQCQNDLPNCYLSYSTRYPLFSCSFNYADYLHITSQCVPSGPIGTESTLETYSICETNGSIANINGVVISPNFPTYIQIYDECKTTIIGIRDRVLKIWINEMALSDSIIYLFIH